MNRTAETVLFNCLTNPTGWACTWRRMPSEAEDGWREGAKRDARRVTLSYYGTIRDWIEFLALPDAYKPEILKGASVRLDDGLIAQIGPRFRLGRKGERLRRLETIRRLAGLAPSLFLVPQTQLS